MTVQIIADSIWEGRRITTFEFTRFWKLMVAQLNTHGLLARSVASSRAIPTQAVMKQVLTDPYLPIFSGAQKGMVGIPLTEAEQESKRAEWLDGRFDALRLSDRLFRDECHKETANRPLEPWEHVHVVVTATEWRNFLALRTKHDAQPDWVPIASEVERLLKEHEPTERRVHTPFVSDEFDLLSKAMRISAARCARTSYLVTERPKKTYSEELDFSCSLAESGHWSPFDHPAIAKPGVHGRFVGWQSFRSTFGDTAHGDLKT